MDLSAEIDENRRILRTVPVVQYTSIVIGIDGDLCRTELPEIFRTGYIAACQHYAIRVNHFPGAFVVDPVNTEFFL